MKLVQVGRFGDEAVGFLIAKALEARRPSQCPCLFAGKVKGSFVKRHERLSLGNQSQRFGRHLEEPIEPEEGRERWQGVTTDPTKRDSVWSNASKSRDVDRGHPA
jgi:hypothetical protein